MAHNPAHPDWYIGDFIEEIKVEGDPRNVVHINTRLIRATGPEDAFEKAMALGKESETEYSNRSGKRVQIFFRGLRQLCLVHEPLEHGAEVLWEEQIQVPQEQIDGWIKAKEDLAAFQPEVFQPSTGPDYGCGEIIAEALKMVEKSKEKVVLPRRKA